MAYVFYQSLIAGSDDEDVFFQDTRLLDPSGNKRVYFNGTHWKDFGDGSARTTLQYHVYDNDGVYALMSSEPLDRSAAYGSVTVAAILSSPERFTTDAFRSCTTLQYVKLPETQKIIPGDAFRECTSLSTAFLGTGLLQIGQYAFYGCSALEKITIPSTLTSIGAYAFSMSSLGYIDFGGTVSQWGSVVKGMNWKGSLSVVIHCTDGTVTE